MIASVGKRRLAWTRLTQTSHCIYLAIFVLRCHIAPCPRRCFIYRLSDWPSHVGDQVSESHSVCLRGGRVESQASASRPARVQLSGRIVQLAGRAGVFKLSGSHPFFHSQLRAVMITQQTRRSMLQTVSEIGEMRCSPSNRWNHYIKLTQSLR